MQVIDRPRLRLISFPAGHPIEAEGPSVLVGRHSQADIRLPMSDVSRHHCRLVHESGGWRVIDLESTNGTFVNGERVREAVLKVGDHLKIAGFEFELPAEDSDVRMTNVSMSQTQRLAG